MLDLICSSIKKAVSEKAEMARIYDSAEKEYFLNNFILFMKPEITSQIRFDLFLELFSDITALIASHHIKINRIYLLSGGYLSKNHTIEQHYKQIHDAAKDPLQFLTGKAKNTFTDVFGIRPADATLLGGWEMLQRYPELDAQRLDEIWQQYEFKKLDSGMYGSKIHYDSREIFLINGFAPKQIAHYTADNQFIVLFDLSSSLDWHFIRYGFCGTTIPAEAERDSLRYYLFSKQKRYATEINVSRNGIHVSAGPIEAVKEKMNFLMIDDPGAIPLGRLLLQHFSLSDLHHMLSDRALMTDDTVASVFNLTENMNSDEAVDLLMKCKPFHWIHQG